MSKVHRLRITDRIFFVTLNLSRRVKPLRANEYTLIIDGLEGSRRHAFLVCGYVLMPDHWHALIWRAYPLTISQVIHDGKKVSPHLLHEWRRIEGPLRQHQFWDRFLRHAKEFNERLVYMHLNPVRKGLVGKPEVWRWSSCNNFSLEKSVVAEFPIQADYVRLPERYLALKH